MTTPGGVPNLPAGGMTLETLAQKLQDMTPAAMRNRAAERMPGTFHGSTGGDPLQDLTPFGILTKLFAGFNSHVANADPNDIQGPEDLPGLLVDFIESLPVIGQFVGLAEAIMGTYDGDDETLLAIQQIFMPIRRLLQLASGQDVGWPTLEEIEEGWGNLFAAIAKAVSQFFKGVIPAAWVADVAKDLTDGAGGFTDPSVVDDNPDWHYDAAQNGHLSGKSIYVNADGHLYVISVKDPFEVAPGQTVDMGASAMWQGLTATAGSNPIRLCITPFGPDGTKLPDIVIKQIQPVAADSAWVRASLTGSWTVPADGSIKWATVTLVVTEGASGGPVHFSNVASVMSNLGPVLGKFRSFFDAIGGQANSGIVQFEQRFAAITADGKITASEIVGLIQQAQVSGLAIMQTVINQILDILNGNIVTPINSLVQGVKDWFGLNQNKTQKLTTGGSLDGNAITGTISDLVSGVAAVRDALTAGMGAVGSTFTNNDAKNQAIYLRQMSAQAAAATSAIQAQIQRNQATAPAGLASYITTFGGSDGAALPAEFTGSDLKIRTANGYCGIDASKPDGTYYVTCNKQTTTDDVQTTVVIGDAGGLNSIATYTLFSSDSTDSTGAYLGVNGNSVQVGKYTRSGAVFTFASPFMSWSGQLGQGIAVTAYRKTNNWVLDVGGDVKATATDATVTTGASNRYGGAIVMMRKTSSGGWFSGSYQYDSLRLASVFLGDFYAKATNYSGARLQRAVGAANTAGPTHPYSLPGNGSVTVTGAWGSGAFGVIGFSSDDMVANTANGTIIVNTSGLYYVEHRDPAWTWSAGTAIEPSASALDVVINTVNHITLEGDYKLLDGTANTDTGSWSVTGHTGVPVPAFLRLNAGDVIQLGYTVTLKNTGSSSRSGNAVFTLTGTAPGLLGIYKMG